MVSRTRGRISSTSNIVSTTPAGTGVASNPTAATTNNASNTRSSSSSTTTTNNEAAGLSAEDRTIRLPTRSISVHTTIAVQAAAEQQQALAGETTRDDGSTATSSNFQEYVHHDLGHVELLTTLYNERVDGGDDNDSFGKSNLVVVGSDNTDADIARITGIQGTSGQSNNCTSTESHSACMRQSCQECCQCQSERNTTTDEMEGAKYCIANDEEDSDYCLKRYLAREEANKHLERILYDKKACVGNINFLSGCGYANSGGRGKQIEELRPGALYQGKQSARGKVHEVCVTIQVFYIFFLHIIFVLMG